MVHSLPLRTKVFISYSHKDVKYAEQLIEHLAYDERYNLIEAWSDKKINAGAQWREEIKQAIGLTKVAVLLISSSFLASKFIAENELPPLLYAAQKEGAIILPVIVRPSNFEETELASFQAVNSPSTPVAKMKGYQRDAFWTTVVRDIKKAVTPQRTIEETNSRSVEKKVIQELPIASDNQIQQVVGMLDFREAINARDWGRAEKVLQKHPNLPEVRSSLGLGISREVQEYFSNQLRPSHSLQLGPLTPLYYAQSVQNQLAPSKREAIHWLEEALLYQDDPEGTVTATLALMYGYDEAYDKMIATLQKVRIINPSLISSFQPSDNLMMLIYACHDLASVEEVMHNINLKLPQKDEVQQILREASEPKNNANFFTQPYIKWYAVEFRTGNISGMPIKVQIVFPGKDGLTYAQFFKQGQPPIIIPTQATTMGIIDTLISVGEILEQLNNMGIVLITLM